MAPAASNALLAALAALAGAATLLLAAGPSRAHAQVAAASGCDLTIRPAERTIRRGGRVQLSGEACGAGASNAGGGSVKVKLRRNKRWSDGSQGRDGLERPLLGLRQGQRPAQCQAGPAARDHQRRHRDDRREGDQERPQRLR